MHRTVVVSSPVCLRGSSRAACEQGRACPLASRALRLPAGARRFPSSTSSSSSKQPRLSCAYGDVAAPAPAEEQAEQCCMLGLPEGLERQYLLGQCIGQGAYGSVRYAYSKSADMEVAIKVLPKRRNGSACTSRSLRKLQREISLHNMLQGTEQVVTLYDAYEDAEHVYLVLEFCGGETLEQLLLSQGPLSERQTALVIHEVLQVVASCHAAGILHGDVKAANFVLAKDSAGRSLEEVAATASSAWLKAIDFGCSQKWRGQPFQMRVGTPVFMAPEVFMRDYALQADLWSTGILFYELFASRFPFWDTLEDCKSRTLDEVMKAVIVDEIDFSSGPWRAMSASGLDLARRLLARDPEQRITAVEALRHPWFVEQGVTAPLPQQQQQQLASSNIVPYHGASAPAAQQQQQQLVS